MKHNFWTRGPHSMTEFIRITDVCKFAAREALTNFCHGKKIWLGWRIERVAMHFSAHVSQPKRQPATLKPGMPGKKNPLAFPKAGIHYHTFQGALPEAHSSSRWFLSRRVSMGCQKPSLNQAFTGPSRSRRS